MNTCQWQEPDDYCFNLVEGRTNYCARHNRLLRKLEQDDKKATEKRKALLLKPMKLRNGISKNPKDWTNTFLCSDGTRVTQAEINELRKEAYQLYDWQDPIEPKKRLNCEGCGILMLKTSHAHIIPQARCKVIGKTELIWDWKNFFHSCDKCNAAIENPKGKAWRNLKNIDQCLEFIKLHDEELFTKFRLSLKEPHTT